jgi:triacylglycerol lipase
MLLGLGKKLELAIGALNGVLGDYLARTGNGLATPMQLMDRTRGAAIAVERAALVRAHPEATGRIVLLLHGSGCTEDVFAFPGGEDYGTMLRRDLGWTPLYLRFNSGRAIPDNGAELAHLLEALLDVYPVPVTELLLLGFSMGGLVARSACHVATLAGQRWLPLVQRAIYVGTPHRGAPLERFGRTFAKLMSAIDDPYTRLAADIGNLRSDGIKDLGDADLRHEDRARRVASHRLRDPEHPVPLLPQIRHHLVAGSVSEVPWLTALFGDSIVPVASATNGSPIPADDVKLMPGVSHLNLAHHPGVYQHILAWSSP